MRITGRFLLFVLILALLTTACKYFFGPDLRWSGFSPVIAIALFAGMIIPQRNLSFILPLIALFVSDAIIQVLYTYGLFEYPGFYSSQWKNYLILLSATLIGWALKGRSYTTVFAGAIIAPTVFFLLSNFNVWLGSEVTYTRNFSGLMSSYTAGLPFYKNALIATMLFVPSILFLYNVMTREKRQLTLA